MTVLFKLLLTVLLVAVTASTVTGRAQTAEDNNATVTDDKVATADEEADVVEEEEVLEGGAEKPVQYPFRDLPADVLRDFPGLCFGSTALRLFQVGQSWSLTPFCGVATCLVSRDAYHLIERVQDCGPQPKRNDKCKNVNAKSEAAFPKCCPVFECEEGVELEYPTQDELQQLAHEAAQAAVRAQYEDLEEEGVDQTGRVVQQEDDEPDVVDVVDEADAESEAPAEK